jgi:hypothetical protein
MVPSSQKAADHRIGDFALIVSEGTRLSIATVRNCSIALIGDAIDTKQPDRSPDDIASALCDQVGNPTGLWDATRHLCGRWVVIAADSSGDVSLFADAAGLCPIFYVVTEHGLQVSSSERALAKSLNLQLRKDVQVPLGNARRDSWWPLGTTAYAGLQRLIPHHLLKQDGQVSRIWPTRPLGAISLEESARTAATILKATMKGIANLYGDVRLATTAGIDSRVLLAAAKAADIPFRCYTYAPADRRSLGQEKRADADVASQLAASLGVPHDLVILPEQAEANTIEAMKSNIDSSMSSATLAREHEALANYVGDGSGVVSINGNLSEIGRSYYGRLPGRHLTGEVLATLTRMQGQPWAEQSYRDWLLGAGDVPKCKLNPLDLLYWEDRMGSWQSTVQQQMNQIWAIITPYNCQALLETMLAAPPATRLNSSLHREILKLLSPELLDFPFNPVTGGIVRRTVSKGKSALKTGARMNPYSNLMWFTVRNRLLKR